MRLYQRLKVALVKNTEVRLKRGKGLPHPTPPHPTPPQLSALIRGNIGETRTHFGHEIQLSIQQHWDREHRDFEKQIRKYRADQGSEYADHRPNNNSPAGAKCLVAITFDRDADNLIHIAELQESQYRLHSTSMGRYGPNVALRRIPDAFCGLRAKAFPR